MFKDRINDTRFNIFPLFVDQSEFNKTTYIPGANHFLSGCLIKQEVILYILKSLPKDTYFLFTDIDIVILEQNGLFEYFQSHIQDNPDMVYMWENSDVVGHNGFTNYNIGISLLRANDKTIAFYEKLIEKGKNQPDLLDQELVCSLLPEFDGKIDTFDRSVLCLSNYYNETEPKSNVRIVQVLCGNSTNYKVNMMQKYMGAKSFGVAIEGYIQEAINNGRTPDELGL